MNIKELAEIRHNILAEVEEDFVEELVPAKLSEKDENDVEVLGVILSGADEIPDSTGEFFFLPSNKDDEIQYFVNLITLVESIPEDKIGELCASVAALNTYVLSGGFAIDFGAGSLVYKLVIPMSIDADKEFVADNVDLSMGLTLQAVSEYGYLLIEVCDGKRTAKSIIDLFVGQTE